MSAWIVLGVIALTFVSFIIFGYLQEEEDRIKEERVRENRKLLKKAKNAYDERSAKLFEIQKALGRDLTEGEKESLARISRWEKEHYANIQGIIDELLSKYSN